MTRPIVGSTVLVVLTQYLLLTDGHIFGVCLFGKHLIFVHQLVIRHVRRSHLVIVRLRGVLLDFIQVVLHLLKVSVLELAVLIQVCTLLTVTQHQIRYFFEIEILVRSKRKDFITIVVVDYNKHFRITISDYLLGLAEEAPLLNIKQLTLLFRLFLI